MDQSQLAISIANCPNINIAENDWKNPCHKIVNYQINRRPGQLPHTPEPWFGNLAESLVIGISSNPSINEDPEAKAEIYPTAEWKDEDKANFFINRIGNFPESFVTFNSSIHNDFLTLCNDGQYRSGTKNETKSQPTWFAVHNRMKEILGESADPRSNYCLTEVVHCKSKNAIGVKKAASTCTEIWFEQKFKISKAPVIIIFGAHARENMKMRLTSASKDFGQSENYSSMSQQDRAMRDILIEEFGGVRRLVIFNFKNGSKELQDLNKVYGSRVVNWVGKIARKETEIPHNSDSLRVTLRNLA
jgi:hypothetical protein